MVSSQYVFVLFSNYAWQKAMAYKASDQAGSELVDLLQVVLKTGCAIDW